MKLSSSQLEAFFAAAKTLNFTKAAEQTHITQSALSQRIAKLEADLETTLFIRDRTSIRLTEAGHRLLRFCQVNNQAEEDLLADLQGAVGALGGVIRLGGFSSITRSILIPALRNLMIENGGLSIELLTREIRDLSDLLRRSEADYIVTTKEEKSDDIESVFLGDEANVLVGSRQYKQHQILLDHDPQDLTTRTYVRVTKSKLKIHSIRYLDDVYGLIDGVKNGYGLAVLPLHLVSSEKDLRVIEPEKIMRVPVYLQFFKQPFFRKVHISIVESIVEGFSSVLD